MRSGATSRSRSRERRYARIAEARRAGLAELLDGWSPEEHDEVRELLERMQRAFVAEIPPERTR